MSVDIRSISPDEFEAFQQSMSVPFSFDPSPEGIDRERQVAEIDRLRAGFDGSQLVATFGAYSLMLTVPGGMLPTAGTTAVTVMPTHRRQGLLRRLMAQHLEEVHERGEPLAALWASEHSIYGRFGYGPASDRRSLTLPKPFAQLRQPVDMRGAMSLLDREAALAVFPDILAAAAVQRPGMYARGEAWWTYRTLSDPTSTRHGATAHRRVLYTRDDQPQGYAIYRTKQAPGNEGQLRLVELIAINPEAEKALWQYLFGVDLVDSIEAWNRPVDDPLDWWLENPRRMQYRVEDSLWVRVVDVVNALSKRLYASAGRMVFRLDDAFCPWNDGVYCLEVDDTGKGCCTRTTSTPELELTPFALGALYLGGRKGQAMARAGVIKGTPIALRQLDALFAWEPLPWCHEVF